MDRRLPESPERDARELELAMPLAQAMWRCQRASIAPETRAPPSAPRPRREERQSHRNLSHRYSDLAGPLCVTGDYSLLARLARSATRPCAARRQPGEPRGRLPRQVADAALSRRSRGTEAQFALWRNFQGSRCFGQYSSAQLGASGIRSWMRVAHGPDRNWPANVSPRRSLWLGEQRTLHPR